MKKEIKYRQEIVHFGKLLHERGYVAATDGNLSVRFGPQSILITPSCISKGTMRAQDMVVVDLQGRKLAGSRNVSSEIAMHLLIYKMREDVNAVVHAHPPVATGYAAAGIFLNPALVCEAVIGLGDVPLAKYATPGTAELADTLAPFIPHHQAILMANHGVVTYAEDLPRAYMRMESVEHFVRIALVSQLLGQQHLLTHDEVEQLAIARQKYQISLDERPVDRQLCRLCRQLFGSPTRSPTVHASRNRLLFAFLIPIAKRHPSKPVSKSRTPNISMSSFDTANSSPTTTRTAELFSLRSRRHSLFPHSPEDIELCQNCVKTPSVRGVGALLERKGDAPSCWIH